MRLRKSFLKFEAVLYLQVSMWSFIAPLNKRMQANPIINHSVWTVVNDQLRGKLINSSLIAGSKHDNIS